MAGNNGNTPSLSPAEWAVLAAQGIPGVAGAAGAAGPAGRLGQLGLREQPEQQGQPALRVAGAARNELRAGMTMGTGLRGNDAVTFAGSTYLRR